MSTGKSLAMLPWFPGDFMKSTRGWSVTAKGVYRELLDAQWDLGALPADVDELRDLIHASAQEWSEGWRRCEPKFPVCGTVRRNARLEQHREKALGLQASRSLGANRTNAKRYAGRVAERDAERFAERSHPSPSPSPSQSPSPTSEPHTVPQGGQGQRRPRSMTVKPTELEQQVIDAYHALLPDHPQVKDWTRNRRRLLRSRIVESKERGESADLIKYWREFFARVDTSDFLCGRRSGDDGAEPFVCDLETLLRPENFLKVIEGSYGISRGNGQHGGAYG